MTSFRELLGAEVVAEDLRGDDPTAALLPSELVALGTVADRRRREFTYGRACARRALRRLGEPELPILRGIQREPLWPPGIVGSITHCDGYCAAAVARQADVLTLGIDVEIHAPLAADSLRVVCSAKERAWLAASPDGPRWDCLIFSAKESVYKAWAPVTGRWLGFQDATIEFDEANGTFEASILPPHASVGDRRPLTLHGRFAVTGGFVLTAVALAA